MKSVICFGEALIDFLLFNQMDQAPLTLNEFRQYPGGAPANAAVAVAKLGGHACFAGQVGDDPFGHFLADALARYHVDVRFLSKHPTAKTALAFVMLDETGDRSFSFHRDNTADILFEKSQVSDEWFENSPILHFCSNTLTDTAIAECTQHVVEKAKQHNALISFDVNLRHNLWAEGEANVARVNNLVEQSHLIKFSKEELDYLAEGDNPAYLKACLEKDCKLILVTDGPNTLRYYTRSVSGELSPPKVSVADTTAGGDAFIGGFLFALSQLDDEYLVDDQLFEASSKLETLLNFAAHCGACAVTKPGAFPALPDKNTTLQSLEQHGQAIAPLNELLRSTS
ncbi:carbohydrate kinase family protein [Marinibactrum halimedae]|uniref:Fructokinase n=1 Tax=Marinibactrum halimedae TaxID=1444977 RepID=A0AA37WKP9_9GAMM|nr:carbohydrate kinase [Marinibactrum halimedae]MCD9460704.1 carbohydrate kinase [Marinibactrum halimedae]GLS25173.1 fructokinase [Marinibactrum halimedae]